MDGLFFAEGQGFEPWIPFGGTRAFQTRLFSHSSILPFGTANIQIFFIVGADGFEPPTPCL